ncbi:ubiquinone biosynthesis protein [Aquincola sp. S2]|uniref:Ubiquinone biosynthesis protein n=1 Tax=Pseudaquabacterium terrae TaxID=2732868 RepID=A0ABX2EKI6_9BURK|nr:ubiquinone biosynthesis protein [Aquabacterium terrae]NRF69169.1 ubiquinone biosynthesis protein [Aquabacterium terrae]
MGDFSAAVSSYPTAVYTVLLGIVLVYWVLAVIGLVDFEHSGLDIDLHIEAQADADPSELTTLASYVVTFGLNGVPFSVAASLLVLYAWVASCLAGMWLLPQLQTLTPLPDGVQTIVAGSVVLLLAFAVAIPLAAATIRPLRKLFITHAALSNHALVGQVCRVVTGVVNARVGRAEVAQRGASINIRVWAEEPNALTKGSSARIVDYDAERARYRIVPAA